MGSTPAALPPDVLRTPDGIFVLHLRSDSGPAGQYLVGRVEHLKSGDSETFASLAALLRFVDRYVASAATALTPADRER